MNSRKSLLNYQAGRGRKSKKTPQCWLFFSVLAVLMVPSTVWGWQGEILEVKSGDLLVVSADGESREIKLYGIECPEKEQPYWEDAKLLTSYFALKKTAEIIPVNTGPDGMPRALVRVRGFKEFVNQRLISHGMAWVSTTQCSAKICVDWKNLEVLARLKSVGLWTSPDPVPPWQWRKLQRTKGLIKRAPESKETLQ